MRGVRRLAFVLAGLVCLEGAGGVAQVYAQAASGEIDERKADLDDLKRRIRDLQKELSETESTRSDAATALAQAEREVSRVERELRKLRNERADAARKLALLEAEQREVEARIAARHGELAEWLRRYYLHGGTDGVASLLSARDPNQLARDAHYLEHLGRARLALIEGLRSDLRSKADRAGEIASRSERLAALEQSQRAQQDALKATHDQRRQALAKIGEQLKAQQREVSALRADEQRLGRLIETLARRAREQAARQAAARAAAERQAAQAAQAQAQGQVRAPAQGGAGSRRSEPVVGEVRQLAGPTPTGVSFAQMRGQLRFPVRGELVGRFGAQRAEGGTTWKGVFIRAAGGTEVRAVAAGEVVFSDWLRGYGNLLIVDHGGDYLSIYGNNDALLREVGDAVLGGDPIASVGASGGGPESGLYFEIRHQGRALDPMQWVRLN